jgi:hypothetical protein
VTNEHVFGFGRHIPSLLEKYAPHIGSDDLLNIISV